MKRRRFFQTVSAATAVPALLGQQQPSTAPPKVDVSNADAVADTQPHFFTPKQFAALTKLADILQPAMGGLPGAREAKAAAFLDFLIGESPTARQKLYREGLDALVKAGFLDADAAKLQSLLAPLRAPWTPAEPSDAVARFLRAAKADVRAATMNSREYNSAGGSSAARSRRFAAQGLYWLPLDTL